jgi:hypothetical protein
LTTFPTGRPEIGVMGFQNSFNPASFKKHLGAFFKYLPFKIAIHGQEARSISGQSPNRPHRPIFINVLPHFEPVKSRMRRG